MRERSAKEKDREKTLAELITESNKAREQIREEQLEQLRNLQHQQSQQATTQAAPAPHILPIVFPANPLQNGQVDDQRRLTDMVGELRGLREELRHRAVDEAETSRGVDQGNGELPQNLGARSGRSIRIGGEKIITGFLRMPNPRVQRIPHA